MDGDEVVQAYIQYPAVERMPVEELKAFKRVSIAKGQEQSVQLKIPVQELQKWDAQQDLWKLYTGEYNILIGPGSRDIQLRSTLRVGTGIK